MKPTEEAAKMYARVSTRYAKGAVEQHCARCDGKLVGAQASRKYRKRFVFVNMYEDASCTRWLNTSVYHIDCWPEVKAASNVIVVHETDDEAVGVKTGAQ